MATDFQILIAKKLGTDVSSHSEEIASALILDLIGPAIFQDDRKEVTDKQIEFARSLGIDVSKKSLRVASAYISSALTQRNLQNIKNLDIKPGDLVALDLYQKRRADENGPKFTKLMRVSSIDKDVLVYFKGGNGQRAWAGSLRLPTKEELLDSRV